jgi:GT2 family glycosyltransferase
MSGERISVVVPTHNRAAAVLRLLHSLERHHTMDGGLEVVVVADGCSDSTVADVRLQTWPFEVEVVETAACGAGAARNAGARRATGELLVFLDDDVEVERTALNVHAAAHAADERLVGLGYLPPVITGRTLFANTLRGWWEAMFDEPRRPGHRYDYRNLLTGHFSIRRDRFLELGGFDERFTCHEDYEFGYRAIRHGLTFRFLPHAVAWHHDVTTLARALERKRAEGLADVVLAVKHPELTASLPLWRPHDGGRFRRLLVFLAWRAPLIGEAVARVQLAVIPLHEAFGLRFRWRARVAAILSYAYWRGVVTASRTASLSLDALHGLAPTASAPAITVDLAEGIDVTREKLDRLRPDSARIVYGERFVGILPAVPGAEPLCGRHVGPFVARFLREEFLMAAAAAGAMPPNIARTVGIGADTAAPRHGSPVTAAM